MCTLELDFVSFLCFALTSNNVPDSPDIKMEAHVE
jgi:hypothetical protein